MKSHDTCGSLAILLSMAFACADTAFAAGSPSRNELTVELIGGDACPGHANSGIAPWVLDTRGAVVRVYADALDFLVHGAGASTLQIDVSAARWEADKATVYRYSRTARMERGSTTLELPLLDGSVNHVSIVAEQAPPESAYRFEVIACPVFSGPPVVFKQEAEKTVTQADLDAKLREIIEAAGKVSAELARFLETNVTFYDGESTVTGTIGTSSSSIGSTRIRVSRQQWREALLEIMCAATDAERRRLEELHFRQFLSQILHEATHRKGLVDGLVPGGTHRESREEKRTTEELVLRVIDLLERLKAAIEANNLTTISLGDGGGLRNEDWRLWFERLTVVAQRQKFYRWQFLGNIPPWRERAERLQARWERFERELDEIRRSNESDARKRELAQARLDVFLDHEFQGKTLREHAREFADAHDMTWEHGFDPTTLRPVNRVDCKTTFMGKTIPVL